MVEIDKVYKSEVFEMYCCIKKLSDRCLNTFIDGLEIGLEDSSTTMKRVYELAIKERNERELNNIERKKNEEEK